MRLRSIVPSIRLSSTYAAARIPITASILLYISYRIARDWEATRDVLEFRWDPIAILLATTSGLGAYTLLVIAWMVLLNHNMHFDRRYLPYYFRIWFVAYIYRYVPGKIMVIAERARMGTRIGIPAVRGSAIAFMETVYVLSAAVYCSLLVMPMFFDKGVLVWAASAGLVLMGSFLSSFLLRYSARVPYLKERLEDLSTLRLTHKAVLAVVLLYVLFWVLLGCSFFFFARMFYPFALSELPYLFGLFTFSYGSGVIAVFAPGGVGVREGILAVGLSELIPSGPAVALALGSRVWFSVLELLLFFLALAIPKPVQAVSTLSAQDS